MERPGEIKKLAKRYNMVRVLRKGKGKHPRWKNRYTGNVVITSGSPSDRNAIKNIEEDFKQANIPNIPIAA